MRNERSCEPGHKEARALIRLPIRVGSGMRGGHRSGVLESRPPHGNRAGAGRPTGDRRDGTTGRSAGRSGASAGVGPERGGAAVPRRCPAPSRASRDATSGAGQIRTAPAARSSGGPEPLPQGAFTAGKQIPGRSSERQDGRAGGRRRGRTNFVRCCHPPYLRTHRLLGKRRPRPRADVRTAMASGISFG